MIFLTYITYLFHKKWQKFGKTKQKGIAFNTALAVFKRHLKEFRNIAKLRNQHEVLNTSSVKPFHTNVLVIVSPAHIKSCEKFKVNCFLYDLKSFQKTPLGRSLWVLKWRPYFHVYRMFSKRLNKTQTIKCIFLNFHP